MPYMIWLYTVLCLLVWITLGLEHVSNDDKNVTKAQHYYSQTDQCMHTQSSGAEATQADWVFLVEHRSVGSSCTIHFLSSLRSFFSVDRICQS
jgi:hypothetical protein